MRQKLGQHFLIDPEIPKAMAEALDPAAGDTIIEIGPGHGELTQAIVAAVIASGAKDVNLIAVEKDPALAGVMRQRFKEYPFVEIVEGDILGFLADNADKPLLQGTFKLVGNLPYYVTGHLLRAVGELSHRPALTLVMVQKEVAERMASGPPRMNRLAASVQFWANVRILLEAPRDVFDPPPEVDSAVVILTPHNDAKARNEIAFYETVRALFAQPRKTILNNLKESLAGRELGQEAMVKILEGAGINPGGRPHDLSIEKISVLADSMDNI